MTPTQAKHTFAALMAKARAHSLTQPDRKKLTVARQMLRRAKRPAMNPRRKSRLSPRRNPVAKIVRLGRAEEVRYHRNIGRQPGYYKHEIRSRKAGVFTIPAGWVYVSGKSILITEGTPRV